MSYENFLKEVPTFTKIIDCTKSLKKQRLYFGCNHDNIPTIVIKWAEQGRGFGEYIFQLKDNKMICDSECDSKEDVKRVLCTMVDQSILLKDIKDNE